MSPSPPPFEVRVTTEGERTVVAAVGEIDLAVADAFERRVREELTRAPVLLDLSELSFLDSSGVRVLDTLLRAVRDHGSTLVVGRQLQDGVRQVLALTGMMDVLPFEPEP